jgi:hypothetical protein
MQLMNDVMCPFIDSFIIVYLDGILIFNKSWQEHILKVTQVLETLKKNQLIANMKKCEFGKESLIYLRHMIGGGEIRVDPNKIVATNQWPIPIVLTQKFHGRNSILDQVHRKISAITTPLHTMTTKGKNFHWGKPQYQAFEDLITCPIYNGHLN